MNTPSLEEMSGETKSGPKLELNQLQFNGNEGKFYLIDRKGGLKDIDGEQQYAKKDIGVSATVIFLKQRRKLQQFRKGEKNLSTNEHNTKADMLTLFGDTNVVKDTNDGLRERYPGLKTTQVLYCLLLLEDKSWELVRLNIKGSALGSENKDKDVMTYYDYISSFKENGANEHFYEYETNLFGVKEKSDLGTYFAMTFSRGESISLNQEMMTKVSMGMSTAYNFCQLSDQYYATKKPEDIQRENAIATKKDEIDTIEYPDEEINLEDIPF